MQFLMRELRDSQSKSIKISQFFFRDFLNVQAFNFIMTFTYPLQGKSNFSRFWV